jgi:hypothetical protein
MGDRDRSMTHPLRQFFVFEHLRADLQPVSQAFAKLAENLDNILPENPEKAAALRFLLQAKDSAVRAVLFKGPEIPQRA